MLSVEGPLIEVDIGSQAGILPGDRALVYFEVAAGSDLLTVEASSGTVVETTKSAAAVEIERGAVVEVGYLVRFEIPEMRLMGSRPGSHENLRPPGRLEEATVAANVAPCLNLRQFPATFSAPVDCLSPGTSVAVTDRLAGWRKVRLPDDSAGWVAEEFLVARGQGPGQQRLESAARWTEGTDLESMRNRLEEAERALEVSEAARRELERDLQDVETKVSDDASSAETLTELQSEMQMSLESLEDLRAYRLKLQIALDKAMLTRDAAIRQTLDRTIADLQDELRRTAGELRKTAEENERSKSLLLVAKSELSALQNQLDASTTATGEAGTVQDPVLEKLDSSRPPPSRIDADSEISTALQEARERERKTELRAVAAERRSTDLELELDRTKETVAELRLRLESDSSHGPQRSPSVAEPLRNGEIRPLETSDTTPSASAPEPEDLAAGRSKPRADDEGKSGNVGNAILEGSAAPVSAPAQRIENLAWRMDGGTLVLVITLDGKVAKDDCEVVRVRSGAPRDVLKIRGIREAVSPSRVEIGEGVVQSLRSGLHRRDGGTEIHLVTDLVRADAGIRKVTIRGNTLVVTIS